MGSGYAARRPTAAKPTTPGKAAKPTAAANSGPKANCGNQLRQSEHFKFELETPGGYMTYIWGVMLSNDSDANADWGGDRNRCMKCLSIQGMLWHRNWLFDL